MFSRFLLFFASGRRGGALRGGAREALTWCTYPRKTLLFRRRAPRLWDQRRRRRTGRGASLPANPCSFVDEHHAFGAGWASDRRNVVLHSPQALALSSTGTTPLGPKAPPANRTWCFTPSKPLLFRRRAPRLWGQRRYRRTGRGASLPALALSSTGTTSLGPKALPANRTWCFTPRKPLLFRRRAPRLWGQRCCQHQFPSV